MAVAKRAVAAGLMLAHVAWAGSLQAKPAPVVGKPVPTETREIQPLTPAVIDNALNIGGDDIRARKVDTRMTVAVTINGKGPYQFLVDSGADTSVVGAKIAADLGLPLASPAILQATTASAVVDRVKVDTLAMGTSVVRDLELPALDEENIGGQGMIGIDALVRQRLMLDFDQRTIRAEDARIPAKFMNGTIVVTARRRRGQLILTQVETAGQPVEAVIDTGSEITIGNLALRDKLIRSKRSNFETIQVIGVTGAVVDLQVARIPELKVGSVTLTNVVMAFADVPPFFAFGMTKKPALLLGTDVMSTFRRVSLDFKSRKVRFQLKKCRYSGIIVNSVKTASIMGVSSRDQMVCGQ